jgi:hypothetical protein
MGASDEATIVAGVVTRSVMEGTLTHSAVVVEQLVMDEQRPLGSCEPPQWFVPAIGQLSEEVLTKAASGDGAGNGAASRDMEAMS